MDLILGSIEQGLIFGIMAIGVFLTFRILNFPDLTVDGSFTLGGAVAATAIINGIDPWVATVLALLTGALAGSITAFLHTKLKINGLLSGILTMTALYSVNLRVMGKANLPLLRQDTIVSFLKEVSQKLPFLPADLSDETLKMIQHLTLVVAFLMMVLAIKLITDWFFRTDLGMAVRATGDNPRMIASFGVNTDQTIFIGLILSNGLVGLSGGLMAQFQGFADVQMGVGMIVIGLASVIIGEVLFGSRSIRLATLAVIGGAVIYRLVIAAALYAQLKPTDIKLITAVIVIAALTLPQYLKNVGKRNRAVLRQGGKR